MASKTYRGSGWPQVLFVALAVLAIGLVFLWPYLGRHETGHQPMRYGDMAAKPADWDPGQMARESLIKAAAEAAQASVSGRWEVIVDRARVAAAAGPDRLRVFVWTLFTAFDALETEEQEGALRAFFETGRDVRFSEVFTVGRGGWLLDWPTLRVALFDYVAQRNSALARELAIDLLQARPEEPGEWALALRELVRGHPTSEWSSLVQVRLREFIHDPEWSSRGSASWVEGFDIVVASETAAYLPDLSKISEDGASRAERFAGFLTADRLVMAAPAACLAALNQDPGLFSEATGVRAGLFARTDVRDATQLEQLIVYFQRRDIGPGERAQFAAGFPHLSAAVTHRLLTAPVVRSTSDSAASVKAVVEHVKEWMAVSRFPEWTGTFSEILRRLEKGSEVSPAS